MSINGGLLARLRYVAIVAVVAGAVGSVGLMFRVGHRNPSRLLLGLFLIWDVAPFIGLGCANMISKRWSVLTRATLYCVTVVVTLSSLAIYGYVAFGPRRPSPAFSFLIVPVASWLVMTIAVPVAALISGRVVTTRGP